MLLGRAASECFAGTADTMTGVSILFALGLYGVRVWLAYQQVKP